MCMCLQNLTNFGTMPVIKFHIADILAVSLKRRRLLKQFINTMFHGEHQELHSLDIIFCSDEYLLEINKTHLQHDYYTDIITFNLSGSDTIVGEIYISIDRVKYNAKLYDGFTKELLRVIFHGCLHLCGYMDKTKSELAIMRHKEEEYLRLFGSP